MYMYECDINAVHESQRQHFAVPVLPEYIAVLFRVLLIYNRSINKGY